MNTIPEDGDKKLSKAVGHYVRFSANYTRILAEEWHSCSNSFSNISPTITGKLRVSLLNVIRLLNYHIADFHHNQFSSEFTK